ncbi:toll-like receptor 5 isoform X2 [Pelmatolapia mariae]|uniref:toll-like receptor 5 isoform X2 n=1 Tax=Pelmatolapia mariae TaxID=158779 RepID=UPI002FE67DBF
MWMLVLQLICTGLCLKVTVSYQTCRLRGQRAWCGFQNHYWVPALPHNITHLYLQSNHISEINSTSLRDFKELQVLNLESQDQTLIIWNNAFLRQRKLTELMLGSNLGLKLQPRAFAGLFDLQILSLYYCSLTDSILSESYLEPLLSLEVLDLSFNNITRLQPDGWCLEAFILAQGRMLEELTNVLIMLVVGEVAHYQLMKCNAVRAFVQRKEYLTWPEDPQDMEWFYERLISDTLKDSKVKKLKQDKPEPGRPEVQPERHDGINAENIKETSM